MALENFTYQYKDILQSKCTKNQKAVRLAQLMTMMEQTFRIPMLKNSEWEEKNKEIIDLYRKISFSRHFK
ncbi:hypothetical protein QFZ87_000219 [Bacillus sp. SLBN-46]|uniref:hypothetical protein n=1 Tax=Bacillus sp. SLBN-46 TaxID=3042283 RepID=UPI002856D132|nr:hypothetical protein [Bacillus sp. SLBN-46]MDR6120622.1 hypothetical protein [Bacillus sp. SLBN-46]